MRKWMGYCVIMLANLLCLVGCGEDENAPDAEEQGAAPRWRYTPAGMILSEEFHISLMS